MSFEGLCRLTIGLNASDGTHAETGDRAVSGVTLKPLIAWIGGSNPTEGMDVCLLCLLLFYM